MRLWIGKGEPCCDFANATIADLRAKLEAAERQIDRLQRAEPIESDYITKRELDLQAKLEEVQRDRDDYRTAFEVTKNMAKAQEQLRYRACAAHPGASDRACVECVQAVHRRANTAEAKLAKAMEALEQARTDLWKIVEATRENVSRGYVSVIAVGGAANATAALAAIREVKS